MEKKDYIIGIDLGTTYSCVGVYRNNKVEIIPNNISGRTTPSVVCFNQSQILTGELAKRQITKNYKNTIYDIKRLIGRNYNDNNIKEDMKLWPFKVEKDSKNKPIIIVDYNNEKKNFFPEQISAILLESLKQNAENFLGQKVTKAVITVPAYFNNLQRQATIDAGRIAGLNVIKIINEPIAAAIAFGLENICKEKKNICVFDLGGGTFDITILEIHNKKFTVKAIGGDSHLGGEDFDNELMKFCIKKFKEENDIDISNDQKALRRLKIVCEKTKIELSSLEDSQIELESLSEDTNFQMSIGRQEFEKICQEKFNKCIEILKTTLEESKLSKTEINEILLIGGSSRIPKIRKMISDFFQKKKLNQTINPDEAIAYGAAIEAALKNNIQNEELDSLEVINVCPLSIGKGIKQGRMSVIIKKNTKIPCEASKSYVTGEDNQDKFMIDIYEGEREFIKDNLLLDKFYIKNIRKAPKGEVAMKIVLSIDENSILKVRAFEKKNEKNCEEVIIHRENRSEEEIERMIEEAKKMKKIDLEKRHRVEALIKLENKINEVSNSQLYKTNKNKIDIKISDLKKWIKTHPNEEKDIYLSQIKEINNFLKNL